MQRGVLQHVAESLGVQAEEEALTAVARVPLSALRRAASEPTSSPLLQLLLRSDCRSARTGIALDPHRAWVVWAGRDSSPLAGDFTHNGVHYLAFDGPGAALAGLRALDRGAGGGWGGRLRAWWAGTEGTEGAPWPDVVLALHEPSGPPSPRSADTLRALAARARLVPVCVLPPTPGEVSRGPVRRLFEGAPPSHVLLGDAATSLPPGLDGVVYQELMAGGGVARL